MPSCSAQRSAMLSEQLLIMRLITTVGMALLLLLSVAGAGHSESDGSASVPLTVTALLDPPVDPLSRDEPVSVATEHAAVVGGSAGSSALVGAALCILGVLCGLVFMVVPRRLWSRRALPDRGLRPRALSILPPPVAHPRATVLSLTQLGLSRT